LTKTRYFALLSATIEDPRETAAAEADRVQSMPIQSIEPRRLYRQIADQIRTLILSKDFGRPRLPPSAIRATARVSRPRSGRR
jgi:hypothetical protein